MDFVSEKFGDQSAFRIVNPNICDFFLNQINRLYGVCPTTIKKFPGAQPCSIMRSDMSVLQSEQFMVAEKTDGTRYLMLLTRSKNGQPFAVMIDRSLAMRVVQLNFDQCVFDGTTLFDGELVLNEDTHQWNYLVFDLIGSGSHMRPSDNFYQRLQNSIHIVSTMLHAVPDRDPFLVAVKKFFPTQEIQTLASAVEMHQGRRSDGLIFVPVHRPVKPYRNRIMYKWKEQTHHTIDCLLRYAAPTDSASTRAVANLELSTANAGSIIKIACQRRLIALPTSVLQRSVVILKMMNATLKNPVRRLAAARTVDSKTAKAPPNASASEFGKNISPNSIDLTAFELLLIDTKNQLIFFDRCDAELNREFLHQHAMQIVAAGHEIVVECCFAGKSSETQKPRWKIMLERKDRSRPNTEFTVQRTIENIEENITLLEIIDCFRKKNDGTWLNIQPALPHVVPTFSGRENRGRENRKNTSGYPNRNFNVTKPYKAAYVQHRMPPIQHQRKQISASTIVDQHVSAKRATWAQTMETVCMPTLSAEKRQRRENFDHRPQWLIDQIRQKNLIADHSIPSSESATMTKEVVEEYNPMMPAYYDYGDEDDTSLEKNPPPVLSNNPEKPAADVLPFFDTVDQNRLLSMLEELQQSLSKIPCESLSLKQDSRL